MTERLTEQGVPILKDAEGTDDEILSVWADLFTAVTEIAYLEDTSVDGKTTSAYMEIDGVVANPPLRCIIIKYINTHTSSPVYLYTSDKNLFDIYINAVIDNYKINKFTEKIWFCPSASSGFRISL